MLVLGPFAGFASAKTAEPLNNLRSSLVEAASDQDANYGVYVLDLNSGKSVVVDPDETFPTASMYKLLVMYRVFQAYDQGSMSPDQQITITDDDLDPEQSGNLVFRGRYPDGGVRVESDDHRER